MKKLTRNVKGFTLIELVIIIIILGILSAVAVPKYNSLRADASEATAQSIVGAIASSDNLLFARYMINNDNNYTNADVISNMNISGATVTMPDGSDSGTGTVVVKGDTYNFTYTAHTANSPGIYTMAAE